MYHIARLCLIELDCTGYENRVLSIDNEIIDKEAYIFTPQFLTWA